MCTVSFIPTKGKVLITSNRDEKYLRKQAVPPAKYKLKDVEIVYPKDADAGGSWIALKNNGSAAVLLNGAFEKHASKPPYKKSRGLIFLDVIKADEPVEQFLQMDLFNIEPFTIIIFHHQQLYECRWNGEQTFYKELNNQQPHIWSSSTLYDRLTVKKREQWFGEWLQHNAEPTQSAILDFHEFTGDGDAHNDLVMNRNDNMFTVSITSMELNDDNGTMRYIDLNDGNPYDEKVLFENNKVEA